MAWRLCFFGKSRPMMAGCVKWMCYHVKYNKLNMLIQIWILLWSKKQAWDREMKAVRRQGRLQSPIKKRVLWSVVVRNALNAAWSLNLISSSRPRLSKCQEKNEDKTANVFVLIIDSVEHINGFLIRHIQSCVWNPLNPKFVRVKAFLVLVVYLECNSFLFFSWTEIMVCHGISNNCLEVIEVVSVSQLDCGCSFNENTHCSVQGQNCPSAKKETRWSSHHICVISRQCWAHYYICLDWTNPLMCSKPELKHFCVFCVCYTWLFLYFFA